MKCPHCDAIQPASRVTRSEPSRARRLYTCLNCGTGWASVEILHSDTIRVPSSWVDAAKRLRLAKMSFRAIGKKLGKDHASVILALSPARRQAKVCRERERRAALSRAEKDQENAALRARRASQRERGSKPVKTADLATYQQSHPG